MKGETGNKARVQSPFWDAEVVWSKGKKKERFTGWWMGADMELDPQPTTQNDTEINH